MLPDSPSLPFDYTGGQRDQGRQTLAALRAGNAAEAAGIIRKWDSGYRARVKATPNVALCRPHFVELHEPPFVSVEELKLVFGGRVTGTRNPGEVGLARLNELLAAKSISPV